MKIYDGYLYETCEDWTPVVIAAPTGMHEAIIWLPNWLSEHCPNAGDDYDAWCHPEDTLMDNTHRTVYFFRDEKVAMLFVLRWA
jgi:hypothetical protein